MHSGRRTEEMKNLILLAGTVLMGLSSTACLTPSSFSFRMDPTTAEWSDRHVAIDLVVPAPPMKNEATREDVFRVASASCPNAKYRGKKCSAMGKGWGGRKHCAAERYYFDCKR